MLFSLGFCEILEHRNAEGDGGHRTSGRSMPIVLQEVQEDPFGRVVGNNFEKNCGGANHVRTFSPCKAFGFNLKGNEKLWDRFEQSNDMICPEFW